MKPYYVRDQVQVFLAPFEEVIASMAGRLFDLIAADPCYGQTSLGWDRWVKDWPSIVRKVLQPNGAMTCWGSLRMFMDHAAEFKEAGFKLSQDIVGADEEAVDIDYIWEKQNGSAFHADRFKRVHEQVAHFYVGSWAETYHQTPVTMDARARTVRRKKRPPHMGHIEQGHYTSVDGGPRLMRSVIYARNMHGRAQNETEKPYEVVRPLHDYSVAGGGSVFIPFGGAGVDAEVAWRRGCSAVLCEIRESQAEATARRLSALLPFRETEESHPAAAGPASTACAPLGGMERTNE